MPDVYKKDNNAIKGIVKEHLKNGLVIGGIELELPCKDIRIDSTKKEK